MAYRPETREGRDFYGRRKGTAEPIFGIVKEVMGIWQFLLRGLEKAGGEWALIRCAFNLKRMHRLAGKASGLNTEVRAPLSSRAWEADQLAKESTIKIDRP